MLRALFSVTFVAALGAQAVAVGPSPKTSLSRGDDRAGSRDRPGNASRTRTLFRRSRAADPRASRRASLASSSLSRLKEHLDVATRFRASSRGSAATIRLPFRSRLGRKRATFR